MLTLIAQKKYEVGGFLEGLGPLGEQSVTSTIENATSKFTLVFSNIIGVMTIVGGLWFILQFIIATYDYLNAGGDMERIKKATRKIVHAILGLVIIVIAYALISLIGRLVGFDILNPQDVINTLTP